MYGLGGYQTNKLSDIQGPQGYNLSIAQGPGAYMQNPSPGYGSLSPTAPQSIQSSMKPEMKPAPFLSTPNPAMGNQTITMTQLLKLLNSQGITK